MVFNARTLCVTLILTAILAAESFGQITPRLPAPKKRPTDQVTPGQVQDILWLRALQSRGRTHGRVRTGVPMFVPFGQPGFFGFPAFPMQDASSSQDSSAQKRAEARAARAARVRAAREKAKARREKAAAERAKARAAEKARARAEAKAAAKAEADDEDSQDPS